jgi:hypothetical protein
MLVLSLPLNKEGLSNRKYIMKKLGLLLVAIFFASALHAQKAGLKNNLIYDAVLTPNLALELALGRKTSLELGAGYNRFSLDGGKQWKHWLAQPEFRWWFCERFNGAFFGVHALGGEYSFARVDFPLNIFDDLKTHRYEGWYAGGGVSFGYQWILSRHWGLEATAGVGYVWTPYEKFTCDECSSLADKGNKSYIGPTKAALSFVFFL